MGAGLSAVLDRLSKLLGKGFLLAGFVPAVIFLAVSALLAFDVSVAFRAWSTSVTDQTLVGLVPLWLVTLFIAVLLGFVLWAINPWLRELLEGRHVRPRVLRDWMIGLQLRERDRLQAEQNALHADLVRLRKARDGLSETMKGLKEARLEGEKKPVGPITAGVADSYRALETERARRGRITAQALQDLRTSLEAELRRVRAKGDAPPGSRAPEHHLDRMHQGFHDLVEYAADRVEDEYRTVSGELSRRFPEALATPGATSFGNMAELHRDYARKRYGMDVDLFWLSLQKLLRKDENFYAIVADAKAQLDSSVAMTTVFALLTATWSPVLLVGGTSWLVFALTFGLGGAATMLFYWIAVRSYRSFGEVLGRSVDLFRFELLTALHVALPESAEAERRLWEQLSAQARCLPAGTLWYRHGE